MSKAKSVKTHYRPRVSGPDQPNFLVCSADIKSAKWTQVTSDVTCLKCARHPQVIAERSRLNNSCLMPPE